MADPVESSTTSKSGVKWLWLLLIVALGVVLLLWGLEGVDDDEGAIEVDAPIGVEAEDGLQPGPDAGDGDGIPAGEDPLVQPADEDAVDVELPESNLELPEEDAME